MSYSMPLTELLAEISIESEQNILISDLAIDSRKVSAGTLFMAYPGYSVDGRDYIEAAQAAGAIAVLYEAGDFQLAKSITIPAFAVSGLRENIGELAHKFYQQPSADMQVFGVTGTNGKTSCCYFLAQAFTKLGMQAAMIGTIGVGPLDDLVDSGHTTPDVIFLHRLLAEFRDQGITQVCIEVSSHALDQQRVGGVQFYCTLFTNLSHDHLDYHGDMASYQAAKQRLFADYASELVITNADDAMGAALIDVANSEFIASYGIDSGDVQCDDLALHKTGINFTVDTSQIEFDLASGLVGEINVPNILLLVCTLLSLSTSTEEIQEIVATLKAAPGRMELHTTENQPSVVIDYAHTPDALEKALLSIQQHCDGKLWCVFGCGGDRDKAKRPLMGDVVARLADVIIVTNDNPRSEDGSDIAADIIQGIDGSKNSKHVEIILDRAVAIKHAINSAHSSDWVLVAGKGHETTQQIGDQFTEFSDRDHVMRALEVAA
ncbi:MAG: UDP-N-acetylmuramoyl-L-alanyl-D-glutamate--2,6-diaminopimelate ligase [Acidiferrobacterales bacterium]|nr:UDP-N-acetylmuramoyl-L-alanyl-D-glutamate--2,6-diaminopimelate ligase [Acidiferrobacterales bacterium]